MKPAVSEWKVGMGSARERRCRLCTEWRFGGTAPKMFRILTTKSLHLSAFWAIRTSEDNPFSYCTIVAYSSSGRSTSSTVLSVVAREHKSNA